MLGKSNSYMYCNNQEKNFPLSEFCSMFIVLNYYVHMYYAQCSLNKVVLQWITTQRTIWRKIYRMCYVQTDFKLFALTKGKDKKHRFSLRAIFKINQSTLVLELQTVFARLNQTRIFIS